MDLTPLRRHRDYRSLIPRSGGMREVESGMFPLAGGMTP